MSVMIVDHAPLQKGLLSVAGRKESTWASGGWRLVYFQVVPLPCIPMKDMQLAFCIAQRRKAMASFQQQWIGRKKRKTNHHVTRPPLFIIRVWVRHVVINTNRTLHNTMYRLSSSVNRTELRPTFRPPHFGIPMVWYGGTLVPYSPTRDHHNTMSETVRCTKIAAAADTGEPCSSPWQRDVPHDSLVHFLHGLFGDHATEEGIPRKHVALCLVR